MNLYEIGAEIVDLQAHLDSLEFQFKVEESPEVRGDLQRQVSLLPDRIRNAEVNLQIAERTGKPASVEAARKAVLAAWRLTGTLVE